MNRPKKPPPSPVVTYKSRALVQAPKVIPALSQEPPVRPGPVLVFRADGQAGRRGSKIFP
jgi:hypothetical protein